MKHYMTGSKHTTPTRKWQRIFAVMDHFEGKHKESPCKICQHCPGNIVRATSSPRRRANA